LRETFQKRQIQKIQVRKYVKHQLSWYVTNSVLTDMDLVKDWNLKKSKRMITRPRNQ